METRDEDLMELYAGGDITAFEELFRRYERRAYDFFWKRTHSRERAADLFQEFFLRVHRFRGTYRADFKFSSWFFRVAHNVFVDDVRRTFRTREATIDCYEEPWLPASAEQQVCTREAVDLVLAGLSDEQAHVLLAAKVEGIGYPELARTLGKSVDSVRQMASRTLRGLRRAHAFVDG
jgi:RNA polymerase sigma-70 factor (ECF subfamily)